MCSLIGANVSSKVNHRLPAGTEALVTVIARDPEETWSWKSTRDAVPIPTSSVPTVKKLFGTVQGAYEGDVPIVAAKAAMFLVVLETAGIREPHSASELPGDSIICISGCARMAIIGPKGERRTFEVQAGQIVFVPQGFFDGISRRSAMTSCVFLLAFNDSISLRSSRTTSASRRRRPGGIRQPRAGRDLRRARMRFRRDRGAAQGGDDRADEGA